jgi:hypothetical protein
MAATYVRDSSVKSKEGKMKLKDCKFYYGGSDLTFAVFSNHACRALYLHSVPLPITGTHIDVYEIEPGVDSRWIAVTQTKGDQNELMLFVREGQHFRKRSLKRIPKALEKEIRKKTGHHKAPPPRERVQHIA